MKKVLFPIAALIAAALIVTASLLGVGKISLNAYSAAPFALLFVLAVSGIADIRFKDDEDDKLSKDECSLSIKEVARIRHTRGLACMMGCLPELFLIFFLDGILKIGISLAVMGIAYLFSRKVYDIELRKALGKEGK